MNNAPIGIFDSGMGGLSVWKVLRHDLPEESLIYFGDGLHCPYGDKDEREVLGHILAAVEALVDRGVKMIVLACNTATMAAIRQLRERYDVPLVGMEPAIKPAVGSTESGVVGVLATQAALGSEWFADLASRYSDSVKIIAGEGTDFVRIVEEGMEETEEAAAAVERALAPMFAAGADRIVLGCTHYPFLGERMRQAAGQRNVEFIDPAPAIVRRVEWLLSENNLKATPGHVPSYDFMSFAGREYVEKLRQKAWQASSENNGGSGITIRGNSPE